MKTTSCLWKKITMTFAMGMCILTNVGCSSIVHKKFDAQGHPTNNMSIREYRKYVVKRIVPTIQDIQQDIDEYVAKYGYQNEVFLGTDASQYLDFVPEENLYIENSTDNDNLNPDEIHVYEMIPGKYYSEKDYLISANCFEQGRCEIKVSILNLGLYIELTKGFRGILSPRDKSKVVFLEKSDYWNLPEISPTLCGDGRDAKYCAHAPFTQQELDELRHLIPSSGAIYVNAEQASQESSIEVVNLDAKK